jgi:predicted phosphodiesterase
MRRAIFSDVHSNLEALQAVLIDAAKNDIQSYLCLGDIVGYNADPYKCLEIVQGLNCPVIKGNHDEAATMTEDLVHFNPHAMQGVLHTRKSLGPGQIAYLKQLPMHREFKDYELVHATMCEPAQWQYVLTEREVWHSIQHQTKSICFIGHTHHPMVFFDDHTGINCLPIKPNHRLTLPMHPDRKFLINVGSVGQPRDNDWRACYVIYDDAAHTLEFRRVKYDIAVTQDKIAAAGLPEALAQRLLVGM